MAKHRYYDRTRETVAATLGTGATVTVNGAVTGQRTFGSHSSIAVGDTFYYLLEDQDSNIWETGLGTWLGSSQFTRTTVLDNSSATTSKLDFGANTEAALVRAAESDTVTRIPIYVTTYAQLSALTGMATGDRAVVVADGIFGEFVYDSTLSATDNGGTIIDGWVRSEVRNTKSYNALWFGASQSASAATNNAAFAALIAAVKADISATGIGQAKIIIPPTDSDKYYEVSQPILFEDMIQIEVTGGQGAHIRNLTTDEYVLHIKGTAGFGNVFGFNVHNIFLSGRSTAGTKPVLQLEKCILSWFSDLYIDTSPDDGINLDGASTENSFSRIKIETCAAEGLNCRSSYNYFSDVYVTGSGGNGITTAAGANYNTFVGCKSFLNNQHGFSNSGDYNSYQGCFGRNNSQSPTLTYSGMSLAGTDNQCLGFRGVDDQGGSATQKWGVRVAGTGNQLIGVVGTGNTSGLVEDAGTSSLLWQAGTAQVPGFTYKTPIIHKNPTIFSDGDTTPDVSGGNFFRTNNTGATSITTFDGGTNGQEITIVVLDANTTFVNGASLLLGGSNIVAGTNDMFRFANIGGVWYGGQITA